MGVSGSWKARRQVPYATALVQGTGWNAVHATVGGPGRGIASHDTLETVPPNIVDEFQPEDYGYCDEDITSSVFGYGVQTGTSERPEWGTEDFRGSVRREFPASGNHHNGVPGGTALRAINTGADAVNTMKGTQPPALMGDDVFKQSGEVEDATTSDPAQLMVQTSMVQRDAVRSGSQTAAGRENASRAPIRSRIPGQRVPVYVDGYRHAEMEPKAQDLIIRPFYVRTAGTGNPADMRVNEMYVSEPLNREPITDPYVGPSVVDAGGGNDTYSYVAEDVLPYV